MATDSVVTRLNPVFSPAHFSRNAGTNVGLGAELWVVAFPPHLPTLMVICHEVFPTGCLLALAPPATADAELAAHLARACRSGTPAVWVDCRLLTTLSDTVVWLLWACQQRLHRRHARLIFCQVPAVVEGILRHTLAGMTDNWVIVPTLDDAAAMDPRTAPAAPATVPLRNVA